MCITEIILFESQVNMTPADYDIEQVDFLVKQQHITA